jgi:uncharacterized Zn-binding protein involved in type VI secretion
MPKSARLGDICTGHGCWPPRANSSASSDVFINGRGAFRVGDGWLPHTCPPIPETHESTQAGGSSSVFVNSKPLARVGDAVACGGSVATGSDNVITG